ncbi:FtsK/SpoIIIE domain-containing protein, partial [Arthrospira platensis SPKY2]
MTDKEQGFWNDWNLIIATAVAIMVLLWTQQFFAACLGAVVTLALLYAAGRGWLTAAVSGCAPLAWRGLVWLASLFKREAEQGGRPYDLLLGYSPLTGAEIIENLAELGHIGVYGTTRYGKTTWLHSLIHWMIENHSANELKLVISDPKQVDYALYNSLPHL